MKEYPLGLPRRKEDRQGHSAIMMKFECFILLTIIVVKFEKKAYLAGACSHVNQTADMHISDGDGQKVVSPIVITSFFGEKLHTNFL